MVLYKYKNWLKRFLDCFMFKFNNESYWKELNSNPNWHGISTTPNDHELIKDKRMKTLKALQEGLCPGSVLEIGAGKKYYTKHMEAWGYETHPTDFAWDVNNYDVTKGPLKEKFDNVVAIGVLHHIMDDVGFSKALGNIKVMAKKRIILGVKIHAKEIKIAKQRPKEAYLKIFGKPIITQDAGYLTVMVFKTEVDRWTG